jgi:restriction system protein
MGILTVSSLVVCSPVSIPDFQTIMLPLLEFTRDGREHTLAEANANLATHFNLTDAERQELLPSGKQSRFNNRVGWSSTHFKKAALFAYPSRGKFQITQRGIDLLNTKPARINCNLLKQFPEYLEFIGATAKSPDLADCPLNQPPSVEQTPDEVMDSAYQELRLNLGVSVISEYQIKRLDLDYFEGE